MKGRAVCTFLLCAAFLLNGCWDRTELNDLAIATAIAIDQAGGDRIKLTAQLLVTKGFSGGQGEGTGEIKTSTIMRSSEGLNLSDALSRLQTRVPREIFWGHTRVYVIGEEVAKKGISGHVEYLIRHPKPRLQGVVYISRGEAAAALAMPHELIERSTGETLRELMSRNFELDTTLVDVRNMLRSGRTGMVIPYLEPGESWRREDPRKEKPFTRGLAIMKKDKMIGSLSAEESRGIIWLLNKIAIATITVQPEDGSGYISYMPIRHTVRFQPDIRKGKTEMIVHIEMNGQLKENTTSLDPSKRDDVAVMERKIKQAIEKDLHRTMNKLQKQWKLDVVGFDESYYEKAPDTWKQQKAQWSQIFSRMQVRYRIKVTLDHPGLIKRAATGKPEDVNKP